jgi:hypothetical protein
VGRPFVTTILDIWKATPEFFEGKGVQQLLAMCGNGKLLDDGLTSKEFRDFLSSLPSERLSSFAAECLTNSFPDGGLALQDVINQIGVNRCPSVFRRAEDQVDDGVNSRVLNGLQDLVDSLAS